MPWWTFFFSLLILFFLILSTKHKTLRYIPFRIHGTIPRVILQVSKEPQSSSVIQQLRQHTPGYTYLNYTDEECIAYLQKHPIPSLPHAITRFLSFTKGPHKADFFRYFFLYQNGGVFLDSDLMLYQNLTPLLQDHDFVTIRSSKSGIFNGFLAVRPHEPVIGRALFDAYHTPDVYLFFDYHRFCRHLWAFLREAHPSTRILLLQESVRDNIGETHDAKGRLVSRHFFRSKIIRDVSDRVSDGDKKDKDDDLDSFPQNNNHIISDSLSSDPERTVDAS